MSNSTELETIIEKHFPENTEFLVKVVRIYGGILHEEAPLIPPLLRQYSSETQETFFRDYLEHLLKICVKGDGSVNDLPRPNIESTAKMMVDITGIPLRMHLPTEDNLKDIASFSLKACGCFPSEPFQVRKVDNIKEIEAQVRGGWKPYKDPVTQEYIEHPLKSKWHAVCSLGRKYGLENFTHTLQDESYSRFPLIDDISDELRRKWKTYVYKGFYPIEVNGWCDNISTQLAFSLTRTLVWEAMGKLLEKDEGYPCDNPLRFYVDMATSKSVPIGWDGKEFLVGQLQK